MERAEDDAEGPGASGGSGDPRTAGKNVLFTPRVSLQSERRGIKKDGERERGTQNAPEEANLLQRESSRSEGDLRSFTLFELFSGRWFPTIPFS